MRTALATGSPLVVYSLYSKKCKTLDEQFSLVLFALCVSFSDLLLSKKLGKIFIQPCKILPRKGRHIPEKIHHPEHILGCGHHGMLAKKRFINDDYDLYDGLHEPIISQEQWDRVKAAQAKKNHNPVNTDRQLKNPFAGILVCGKCGAIMKRTVPDKKRNPTPWYRCSSRDCDCKIIKCTTVEKSIYDAMDEWLEEYMIHLESDDQPQEDPIATALEAVRWQLADLQLQQENICEYLEKGIYTIDMFTKRNAALSKEIKQLQISEADLLRQQAEGNQKVKRHPKSFL